MRLTPPSLAGLRAWPFLISPARLGAAAALAVFVLVPFGLAPFGLAPFGLAPFGLAGARPAQAAPPGCAGSDIGHVSVPIDYARPDGSRFPLAFRLRRGSESGHPLILLLPGGPGNTLIRGDAMDGEDGIPPAYDVVMTDPRGAGCNDDPALSDDADFRSDFLARDVLAILGALGAARSAPLDYVLYGESYGTLEATMIAVLAGAEGLPRPRALVLEGTLGRSFADYAEQLAALQEEWRHLRERLPRPTRAMFQNGSFNPLLSASSEVWAELVDRDLMRGAGPDGRYVLERQLDALIELQGALGAIAEETTAAPDQTRRLLRVIACRELTGELYPRHDLIEGQLVPEGADLCRGLPRLDRRFDAAAWPVFVPIVYVQGSHDPATPMWQARYHFDSERTAPRYFITVDEAAHAPLGVTLAVDGCHARLWRSITGDRSGLAAATAFCDGKLATGHATLEYRPAETGP